MLSGFILSHVYLRGWEAKRFRYGSFLWARIARIFPLHICDPPRHRGLLGGVATL